MKEITPKNVLKELYSEYSSTYSALYARQEKYLVDNFVSRCRAISGAMLTRANFCREKSRSQTSLLNN
jgi:hypothetical protein